MRVAAGSPPARSLPDDAEASGHVPPGLLRVLGDDGLADPATAPALPPEILLSIHREMLRARLIDAAMVELQRQGRLPSYVAAEGQEAVAVGATFALQQTDWIFPAFRENAVLLARGFPLEGFLAQLLGSALDSQKGRQAPGYMSARSLCVASTSSAVATQLPHAVGLAWASRRDRVPRAVLAFVGDGGTSSGDFHAALNFAGVFRAPCIVIVQNNQWAMSTPSARQTAAANFAIKGRAYGVPSVRVDGGDALAVYRAVATARTRAVSGGGPTLLECVTTCAPPRSPSERDDDESAPSGERSRGPAFSSGDPIRRLGRHLELAGLIEAATVSRSTSEITEEIARALDRAEALPAPDWSTLFDDVYAVRPWHLDEQARSRGRS